MASETDPTPRFAEVDVQKAVGILAVVWIHSLSPIWDPEASCFEVWWAHATRFAVPGFLAASGYLYARAEPIRWETTRRRLARILVPYLLASGAAEIFWALRGEPRWGSLASDLLLGAAFGPYYYVPQILLLTLLAPLLARLPRALLVFLAVAALAGQAITESDALEARRTLFFELRNPLRWWAYFLLGWLVRLHRDAALAWIARRRRAVGAAAALVLLLCSFFPAAHGSPAGPRLAGWLGVHATLVLVFAASAGRPPAPRPVRALSHATYAVYLLHLFFVIPLGSALEPWLHSGALLALATWGGGVLASLAAIAVLRALLGERARLLLGA